MAARSAIRARQREHIVDNCDTGEREHAVVPGSAWGGTVKMSCDSTARSAGIPGASVAFPPGATTARGFRRRSRSGSSTRFSRWGGARASRGRAWGRGRPSAATWPAAWPAT